MARPKNSTRITSLQVGRMLPDDSKPPKIMTTFTDDLGKELFTIGLELSEARVLHYGADVVLSVERETQTRGPNKRTTEKPAEEASEASKDTAESVAKDVEKAVQATQSSKVDQAKGKRDKRSNSQPESVATV